MKVRLALLQEKKKRLVQDITPSQLQTETIRTPEAGVKVVEASKPASVIEMINLRIPTRSRRRVGVGLAGRLAKTRSGSSSGYSSRVFGCNIAISWRRS